ncbi:MAG: metal ABC transporter permease, partial [Spirochaetales bacterium]
MNLLTLLSYPTILIGGLVLLGSGFIFPIPGIFILRLNLIPLRFVLMHGALLGGAIALFVQVNPLPIVLGVNLLLIVCITLWGGRKGIEGRSIFLQGAQITTFLMVTTIALAFLILYKAEIPAKDTLSLLWGSIYALDSLDLWMFLGVSLSNFFYLIKFHREILAVLYDREIATTSGVRTELHLYVITTLAGLTVSLAMRFLGALLEPA